MTKALLVEDKEHLNRGLSNKHFLKVMKTINTSIFILLFCLSFSTTILAQNATIDSLKNELSLHTTKDTIRVNILNDLAYSYYQKDSIKTLIYLEESEALANTLNFSKGKGKSRYIKGIAQAVQLNFDQGFQRFNEALQWYKTIHFKPGISECYKAMGTLFYNKGDQKKAIAYYKKSLKINEEIENKKEVAVNLNKIGKAYVKLGNYTEGIAYYKKALNIDKGVNSQKRMAHSYNNIGAIYSDQGNYPLALEYYNKSLDIDERFKDSLGISKSLNNIGIIYKNLKNYDKAIATYEKALIIQERNVDKKNSAEILNNLGLVYKNKKSYKTAHKYLKDALKISEEIKNKTYIATCLNNIGDVYLLLNDTKFAHEYFEKGRKINLEIENLRGLCNSYLGIAKVYANQKKYNIALIYALKSNALSSKLELINYQSEVQELLSKIYKNTGNYKKALESHQQFKVLNDSLFNKKNIQKITQLEYEYKYKKALDSASIRELQLTKTVTATNKDLAKSKQDYLWAIIGVLLVSILLGGIIFFLKLRNVKSKAKNIVTEQRLLRSQMTPHFIFNSLSVLQGMILNKEAEKSVSYLSKFSKLLRITLENSRHKTVSLCKELSAIENY